MIFTPCYINSMHIHTQMLDKLYVQLLRQAVQKGAVEQSSLLLELKR